MPLKTDFKNDVFIGNRKYNEIINSDGSKSLIDVTEYEQVGDSFGASEINQTNDTVNKIHVIPNPSPIKAGDGVAGNLLTWVEETGQWEANEFGQPYDGTNIILPGGKYVEEGFFTGEEGYKLYRQEDGTIGTDSRTIDKYIGYVLDEDTALIGAYGGIDKSYEEDLTNFIIIPGQTNYIWMQYTLPGDADGVMFRWKATAWTSGDDETTGTLISNETTSYTGNNVWLKVSTFIAGTQYFIKAFPYKGSVYNTNIGSNEISITPQNGLASWDYDTGVGSGVEDQFASHDLGVSGVTFTAAKIGNGAYFNASAYLSETPDWTPNEFTFVTNFNTANFSAIKFLADETENYGGISFGWAIGISTSGNVFIYYGNGWAAAINAKTFTMTPLNTSTDYFIAVYINKTAGTAKLWIDNVYIGQVTGMSIDMSNVPRFRIGYYERGAWYSGVMTLDQTKIYQGELSDDSRTKLWNGGALC